MNIAPSLFAPKEEKLESPIPTDDVIVHGSIEKILYLNPENDFMVAKFFMEGAENSFTALGPFGVAHLGDALQLVGRWETDPKFGKQLRVINYRMRYPTTQKGIVNFLSSGKIDGIKRGYAERIVDTFGLETIRILSEHPERLSEVKGLGKKRAEKLLASWKENYAVRDIMMFLQDHDISASFASRIFKQYGFQSVEVLKQNPYRLAYEVTGIGFLSADKVAHAFGVQKDNPMRIESGLVYVLGKSTEHGHVFTPEAILMEEACILLKVEPDKICEGLEQLKSKGKVIEQISSKNEQVIYLPTLLSAEQGVVDHLRRLRATPATHRIENPEAVLEEASKRSFLQFAEAQRQAILCGLKEKGLVITGGPGTGKTTLLRTLVNIYVEQGLKVMLGAPTGRAAKRISESTGHEAKTIHRLLEFNPRFGGFIRNENNLLEADAVLIDEVSMLDLILLHHLLSALPDACRLILIGDVDQLPSVGPGTVLKDLLQSNILRSVRLETVFRQAEGSAIIINAHRINHGENLAKENSEGQDDNFYFIRKAEPEAIAAAIEELVCNRIPQRFGFDPVKDIQVLSPMHKGIVGVAALNQKLQARLNLNPKIPVRRHLDLAVGDKVMQTANKYDKDIYNGDLGFVQTIDTENQNVTLLFDQKTVQCSFTEMDEIVLAYAITIHKSQGSEYPVVIVPVTTQHYTMLQRNLFYTAITRGKKLVILVGTDKALSMAIKNDQRDARYSDLAVKLQKIF
jgi:exodeoxyribonuclease V alpha subunit